MNHKNHVPLSRPRAHHQLLSDDAVVFPIDLRSPRSKDETKR